MPLRGYLIRLVLTTIIPVALFAAVVGYFLVREQRETYRRGAEDRTLAVVTAVDNELVGSVSTLLALATAPALDASDLKSFRDRAQRVLAVRPEWQNINLARPDGQQVMNLQVPAGRALPNIGTLDGSFERLRATGKPVVSDLAVGPVLKRWSFAVRVPVTRNGTLRYVLSAGVRAESISRVIQAQGLPAEWVGVVVDRNGRIVARNFKPEDTVGSPASESLRAALAQSDSGWFSGSTLEGAKVYTPYRRSDISGWSFAMGIPAGVVDQAAWRAAVGLAFGLLAALALAFALARRVGLRISAPIAALASATTAIGRGDPVSVPEASEIEEVRRLARTLRETLETLQRNDREKDRFLAVLSHELRNPLAAMATSAHILEGADAGSEDALAATGIIGRQTRHMARLVDDLLDINRISLGKIALKRERFDLADAIGSVASAWRSPDRLPAHELSVAVEPCMLEADRARVEQVLDNLVDNAVKFSPAGGKIRVTLACRPGAALVRVSDEGIGLTPEECTRAFELFAQGERSQGGLGIGLALVRQLVELHGGTAAAFSDGHGRGTTIELRLPRSESPGPIGEKRDGRALAEPA